MIDYSCCPACNGKRRNRTAHSMVFECRRCGAVYGECYKGESYEIVLPYMARDPNIPAERLRYYDLMVLGSGGVSRRHGWFDTETRLIVQVG